MCRIVHELCAGIFKWSGGRGKRADGELRDNFFELPRRETRKGSVAGEGKYPINGEQDGED